MSALMGWQGVYLNMDIQTKFGSWLRSKRKSVRLSQEELAFRIGRSGGLISQLENGLNYSTKKPLNPTPEQLIDLVNALQTYGADVTVHEAFTQAGIPIPLAKYEGIDPSKIYPVEPFMTPIYTIGDYVIIDSLDSLDELERVGKNCIVVVKGERRLLTFEGPWREEERKGYNFSLPNVERIKGEVFFLPANEVHIEGAIVHVIVDDDFYHLQRKQFNH